MNSEARGWPTALSSDSPTATALGVPQKMLANSAKEPWMASSKHRCRKRPNLQINDVKDQNGVGRKESVLNGIEGPNHTTSCGEERDPIS